MEVFSMTRDINGYNGFGLKFSDVKYSVIMESGVEHHFTVPPSQNSTYPEVLAVFSFSVKGVWVAHNETATLPGVSFAETTAELDPGGRLVQAGDLLSFISNNPSVEVGVVFYAAY